MSLRAWLFVKLKLVPLRLLLRFGLTFSFSDSASFVKLFDFECRFCFCYLKKKKSFGPPQGKLRINPRTSIAQREDVIRRTVYVSDIDQQVCKSFHLSSMVLPQACDILTYTNFLGA